jgi:hypothetical protein
VITGTNTAKHASGRALHKTVVCKRVKYINYLEDIEVEGRKISRSILKTKGWERVD